MISFTVTDAERGLARRIADRAVTMASQHNGIERKRIDYEMDIIACHANGCPLRLADLLIADDFNFSHDVFGIMRHLDRDTGQLKDCFVPRFNARTKV